jgi:hypothetical protein
VGTYCRCSKSKNFNRYIYYIVFDLLFFKGKVAVRSSNVLPALFDVKTQQRNKENLLCYHAVSNVIQLLTED